MEFGEYSLKMTSGGNNFNYFAENQLTTNLMLEMWEILVMRRVSGRWLQNVGVFREMQLTW